MTPLDIWLREHHYLSVAFWKTPNPPFVTMTTTVAADLPRLPLEEGLTSFYVPTAELTDHVLSAGTPSNPLILLQHGFPELAFSWRKVMLPLAAAGFHASLFHWKSFLFTSSDLQLDTKGRIMPDLHEHTCRGP